MEASNLKINGHVMTKVVKGLSQKEAIRGFTELTKLTEDYDDGFYICDLGEVVRLYQWWKMSFPRIRPFFAIKAAPHLPLLAIIAAVGGGFDSAGKVETELALEAGATPDDIIFTHPHKRLSHVDHSRKKNIKTLVFDDELELNKLKKSYPDANLLLRIVTDGNNTVHSLSDKFGATMETSYELLRKAKELDMNVVGICFHVGCGCSDANAYTKSLQNSRKLFDFAKTLGMNFTILDIGGGFTTGRVAGDSMEKMAVKINSDLDELFPIAYHKDLKIISEPGRYFGLSTFTLATTVITKKESRFDNVDVEYTLTEGAHGAFFYLRDNFPEEMIPFVLEQNKNSKEEDKKEQYARLWGPTCDGHDISSEKMLVPNVEPGDWLYFRNAGAYSFARNTNFNGFTTGKIHIIISTENEKIFWSLCKDKIQRV